MVAPEAVRQAVGGGCQSGWGRLLSVTNANEPGTCRQRDNGWASRGSGGCLPPFQCMCWGGVNSPIPQMKSGNTTGCHTGRRAADMTQRRTVVPGGGSSGGSACRPAPRPRREGAVVRDALVHPPRRRFCRDEPEARAPDPLAGHLLVDGVLLPRSCVPLRAWGRGGAGGGTGIAKRSATSAVNRQAGHGGGLVRTGHATSARQGSCVSLGLSPALCATQ